MTDQEMGWDKSEKSVKRAILSTFGIHDFILGEHTPGSYAQARIIKGVFYDRVNSYLDMLSIVLTNLAQTIENSKSLLVWWERCQATDPQEENKMYVQGRKTNDISSNEFRAQVGLPPDEDRNEAIITPMIAPHVKEMIFSLSKGEASHDQALAYFEGLGVSTELAERLAGEEERPIIPFPEEVVA
jgi:hypothetical protein